MKKKILVVMLAVGMVATSLTGCGFETESKKVTYNMKQEAENFNVLRRFAVINTRTDKVVPSAPASVTLPAAGAETFSPLAAA